ncbi:MAG: hypothetical protein ABSG19_12245 [Candidatus Aminicenantales bacterium]
MSNLNPGIPGKGRASLLAFLALAAAVFPPSGCTRAKPKPELTCAIIELRPNGGTKYYDAVVQVATITLQDALKEQFQVLTPTSSYDLASLKFTVDGNDPSRLEAGDTFIVPLKRPDWKFSVMDGDKEYCAENFWDRLPVADRFHPTKTEAMDVARSLELVNERGVLKPVPASLPPEWQLVEDKNAEADTPVSSVVYQKTRGGRIVEQVEVQYALLSEEEKAQLASSSPAEFLSTWSECAKKGGSLADIAGHSAIACDLEGVGDFGWTYRYFYISSNMVVAVDVQSDPEELGKTEQEKEQERRTEQIFLRYGYGPVGKEEWQVMIELRMNRSGAFHKRSRAGESVDKEFKVSEEEFAAIEKALADNQFMSLESRSAAGPGLESFLAVRSLSGARTVNMKNVRVPAFEEIAGAIRRIVLPKVDENGMQSATR